jgi:hypothetical protein
VSRSDFDLSLRLGQEREVAFDRILRGAPDTVVTLELKDEHKARRTVFIEHEDYGRPSGIAVTKADYWAIEVRRDWWVMLPTDDVRMLWRAALDRFGLRHGGDADAAYGAIVPKEWLVNK